MKEKELEDKIRSSEVQEILGKSPGWLITWGSLIILLIFSMLLFFSFLIDYPDIISGRVTITTEIPPAKLIAKSSGRLRLLVKDKQTVTKGTYLAYIHNSSDMSSIETFRVKLHQLKDIVHRSGNVKELELLLHSDQHLELGDLQPAYIKFRSSCLDYILFLNLGTQTKQAIAIDKQIQAYQKMDKVLANKKQLNERELKIARRKFHADSALSADVIISGNDMDKTERYFLETKRSYELNTQEAIQNELQVQDLEIKKQVLLLERQKDEDRLKLQLKNTFDELVKDFRNWEERYVFKAPFNGEVSFFNYWHDGQFVSPGEELVSVVSKEDTSVFGRLYVPTESFGKVKNGQKVRILLDSYPFSEYGAVNGRVTAISTLNRDNAYLIYVALPQKLKTTYDRQIEFKQEMQGTAEIITEDLSLIERFTYSLRNTFKQKGNLKAEKKKKGTSSPEQDHETGSNM